MDASYFREKAETCRRLANDLRWNNPARFHLMDVAEDLQKRAELAQPDRFAEIKADYVQDGPGRSNLRYGYVRNAG